MKILLFLFLLLVIVLIGLFLQSLATYRTRMKIITDVRARGGVVRRVEPSSGVHVQHMETTGSVLVRATREGVYVETDTGGTISAVVDGVEIEETLQPGEKRFFGRH